MVIEGYCSHIKMPDQLYTLYSYQNYGTFHDMLAEECWSTRLGIWMKQFSNVCSVSRCFVPVVERFSFHICSVKHLNFGQYVVAFILCSLCCWGLVFLAQALHSITFQYNLKFVGHVMKNKTSTWIICMCLCSHCWYKNLVETACILALARIFRRASVT